MCGVTDFSHTCLCLFVPSCFCLIMLDDKMYIQSAKANKQNKEKQLLSNWVRAYSLDHFNPTTNCLGDSWNPWTISNTDLRKEKEKQETLLVTKMEYTEYLAHKVPKPSHPRDDKSEQWDNSDESKWYESVSLKKLYLQKRWFPILFHSL